MDTTFAGNSGPDVPGNKRHFKKEIMFNKSMLPLVVLFLIAGILVLVFRESLENKGVDWQVVSGGNLFLYLVTVVSVHMLNKGMVAKNTAAFLRNAYTGIMIKLFACAGAAFIYILAAGKNLNKPALFCCMGLYLLYSFIEFRMILKQANTSRNG